jgi:hypothetical protein
VLALKLARESTLPSGYPPNWTPDQTAVAAGREADREAHQGRIEQRRRGADAGDRDRQLTQNPAAGTAPAAKKRALDQSTTVPGDNRYERALPSGWCDWCLACHPYGDNNGSYHIRPPRDNKAMHNAIASGTMPRVDPWADLKAAQAARATIEAPKPRRSAASTWNPSEEVMAIIKSGDLDRISADIARQKIEDDETRASEKAQAAHAATAAMPTYKYGSYAPVASTPGVGTYHNPSYSQFGANVPTGPPSKKRRREAAARNDRQQQQSNNTRPKKAPRVANPAPATSESPDAPPTFQQPHYQSMAAPSAPVSNNETQGVQRPLRQEVAASSVLSSKKDAEPSDAPAVKAGYDVTPT